MNFPYSGFHEEMLRCAIQGIRRGKEGDQGITGQTFVSGELGIKCGAGVALWELDEASNLQNWKELALVSPSFSHTQDGRGRAGPISRSPCQRSGST